MPLRRIDQTVIYALGELQGFFTLGHETLVRCVTRPFYYRELVLQLDKLGVGSLFIICLTGLFTGMVMALQGLIQMRPFAATSYVGAMVGATMVKELGPVLASLMVAGRVGSAITAELGTMVVTEQVDAMRVEGTDIVRRLVVPRLLALLLVMPLLTLVADAISLAGGYLIAAGYGINPTMYWKSTTQFLKFIDLAEGVLKPAVFGFIIAITACQVGLGVAGGAEGVGAGTQRTVVRASVLILVTDFFLTKIIVALR